MAGIGEPTGTGSRGWRRVGRAYLAPLGVMKMSGKQTVAVVAQQF